METHTESADDAPVAVAERTYAVAYQTLAGVNYNSFFRGKGTLVVQVARTEGCRFEFSGCTRKRSAGAQPVTRTFGPADIWNVAVRGREVRFMTSGGAAGARKLPFVFFCVDADAAATVACLLPRHTDADDQAAREFAARCAALPAASRPWGSVTNLVIATNVVAFISMAAFLDAGWFNVTSLAPYVRCGANNGGATTDGAWWRLLTSMFMHFGLLHLALNMWALFQAGRLVEKLFGRGLYAAVYLGSGLAGGFASILWNGDRLWSAGASGAIFGVYGALLGYLFHEQQALPRSVLQPMLKSTLGFAGYNLLYGALHAGIDNAAHVGGFLGGLALGWLTALPLDLAARRQLMPRRGVTAFVAIVAFSLAGVWCTPRYPYRMQDELAWAAANKIPGEQEQALIGRQSKLMRNLQREAGCDEMCRLLTDEIIPFYGRWRQTVGALALAPGRLTERRRQAFNRALDMRIANYRRLVAGVQARDNAAIVAYVQEDYRIGIEIARMAAIK